MNMLHYAVVAFLLSIVIGTLRVKWIYIELKNGNTPAIWRIKAFQTVTWIVVALLSIYSAFVFTLFLENFLPKLIAQFLFGVILVIRWLTSGLIGHSLGEKQMQKG